METSAQQATRQQAVRPASPSSTATPASNHRPSLDCYCVTCHNERLKTADLRLDRIDVANPGANPSLGEGGAQGAHGHDAAAQHAAAFPGRSARAADVAGNIARCGFRRQTESGPHRDAPPSESDRVSERRSETCWLSTSMPRRSCHPMRAVMASTTSRSATCRRRSSTATSRPRRKSAASRSAARSRLSRPTPSACRPIYAGKPCRRPADWHARRRVDPLHVRPGRRVRHPDLARARSERERRRDCARAACARADRARRPAAGRELHDPEARRRRHDAGQGFESARHRAAQARTRSASHSSRMARRCSKRRQPLQSHFNERRHPRTGPQSTRFR